MKKRITIFTSFLISISCYSQSILRPDLVFSIDTPFVFTHFEGLLITEEFMNVRKEHVFDTIYSANYGKNKKIKEEFNNSDFKSILKYEYDSLDRIIRTTEYILSQFKGKNGLTDIFKSLYFYNNFDSISSIERYCCARKRKDEIVEKEKEKIKKSETIEELLENCQQSYSDYTNSWDWSYEAKVDNFYDKRHNRIMTKISSKEFGLDSKWIYGYDSVNRKIKETYCNFSFKQGFSRDTNSCQELHKLYFIYNNDSVIQIDTLFGGASMIVTKTKSLFNSIGNKINTVETSEQFDRTKNYAKEGENRKEIKFYYNDNGRLMKRTEYCSGCSDSIRYVYIYNKK
jgi:hypothetical protein